MVEPTREPPIFGQNGAVLNSATMSDALRAQYDRPKVMKGIVRLTHEAVRAVGVFGVITTVMCALFFAREAYPEAIEAIAWTLAASGLLYWLYLLARQIQHRLALQFIDQTLFSHLASVQFLLLLTDQYHAFLPGAAVWFAILGWYAARWTYFKLVKRSRYRPFG